MRAPRGDAAALARLARLRLGAALRTRGRELASPKGVLSVLAIALFVGFVVRSLHGEGPLRPPAFARDVVGDETLLGLGLLVACVFSAMTSRGPALHFGPAEMSILFAAPVRRHMLVLYKILSYAVGAVLSGALVALLLPPSGTSRAQLFVGLVLTLSFLQLASTLASIALVLLRRRWPIAGSRGTALLVALAGALALIAHVVTHDAGVSGSLSAPLASMAGSIFWQVVLAPFALIAGLCLPAGSPLAFALRLTLALALLGAMVALVVRLDGRVQEELADSSRAAHRRWQAMLRSGSPWQREVGTLRSRRVPRRRWAGIAPLAWSQGLRLWRTAAPLACWLFALALGGGAVLGALATASGATNAAAMLFFVFAFVLPRMLVFDFRGAPRVIELTRTLPVSPLVVCAGQLAVPVLVVVALQWTMIGAALPFVDGAWRPLLVVLALVLVPFNVLHYALENLVFLLAPVRLVPVGRMDFDFLGRTLLEFLVKCAVLVLAVGTAFAAGVASLALVPGAWPLAIAAATATLALQAALALVALARAYARFDGTRHAFD